MATPEELSTFLDQLYRKHAGELVASLLSLFNLAHMEWAEDQVQETFIAAWNNWQKKGIPEKPKAWLYKVCKNKALNELKRSWNAKTTDFGTSPQVLQTSKVEYAFQPSEVWENQLRLLFSLCHPQFSQKAQIILTLKSLGGFSVEEIAQALLMKPDAVRKTLSRVKKQLREQKLPLKIPFLLQSTQRLNSVHQILYLLFNKGYNNLSGTEIIRKDLCLEAIRLTKALLERTSIANGDTQALFSLMLFSVARFESRINDKGELMELEEQDRSTWDKGFIQQGILFFNQARKKTSWSRYHIEAGIASLHSTAKTFDDTPWKEILHLYNQLMEMIPSDTLNMNRAIAMFYSGEREAAWRELIECKSLIGNPLYHASLAKFSAIIGELEEARDFYLEAYQATSLPILKQHFSKKIEELS
ncbi:MAG: sigma-70 family RNA polymerase sigma factor [Bacteroidota bacterium]